MKPRLFLWVAALASLVGLVSIACSSSKERGALMIGLETDLNVPKNVDGIGIAVGVDGQIKYSRLFTLDQTLAGKGQRVVKLPATINVLEPPSGSPAIEIRAVAFSQGDARVVRDIVTTVPHARTALMRVPLAYLGYKDGTTGHIDVGNFETLPASGTRETIHLDGTGGTTGGLAADLFTNVSSRCWLDQGKTNVDGECVDPRLDSSTLPDYVEKSLFENGVDPAGLPLPVHCFDMDTCFAPSISSAVPLDRSTPGECKAKLTGGSEDELNVAMITQGAGFLVGASTMVPLSADPVHGFWVRSDGFVMLPMGVCDRADPNGAGAPFVNKVQLAYGGAGCAQKLPAVQIDGAGANCIDTGTADGGALGDASTSDADASDSGGGPPPWSLGLIPAVVSVAVSSPHVIAVGLDQEFYFLDGTAAGANLRFKGTIADSGVPSAQVAFVAADATNAYLSYGGSLAVVATPDYVKNIANVSFTSGAALPNDTIMMPVTGCNGGTCYPVVNRLDDTMLMGVGGAPSALQSFTLESTGSALGGAFALGNDGLATSGTVYGVFNSPKGTGGDTVLGKLGVAGALLTLPSAKAYAIAAVPNPNSGNSVLVFTATDPASGGAVRLGYWSVGDPGPTFIGPTIDAAPSVTTFMHNLAQDANGRVYFTASDGGLYLLNTLATPPTVQTLGSVAPASYGVAVDTMASAVYRAYAGGLTRDALPIPP